MSIRYLVAGEKFAHKKDRFQGNKKLLFFINEIVSFWLHDFIPCEIKQQRKSVQILSLVGMESRRDCSHSAPPNPAPAHKVHWPFSDENTFFLVCKKIK